MAWPERGSMAGHCDKAALRVTVRQRLGKRVVASLTLGYGAAQCQRLLAEITECPVYAIERIHAMLRSNVGL